MAVRHPSPLCSLRISQTARLGRGMPRPWASLKTGCFSQTAVKPIFSQNPMESRTERRWLKRAPPTMCPPRAKATHSPHTGNVKPWPAPSKLSMSWCAKVCVDLNQSRISECAVFRASVLCIHFRLESK